jgi:septin family protein
LALEKQGCFEYFLRYKGAVMNFIIILAVLAVVLIMWQVHSGKVAKADRLSDERKQKEIIEMEKRNKLLAEERMFEQRETRKRQKEVEDMGQQTRIERDAKEAELRRKIKERKDREAEENTGKGEK